MRENYSLSKESSKQEEKNTTCTLSKEYKITIPKFIRQEFNLICGDEVTISLTSKELIIRKQLEDTLENRMVLNDRGTVKIPQEFIKILSLQKGDVFNIYLANSCILLRRLKIKDRPVLT